MCNCGSGRTSLGTLSPEAGPKGPALQTGGPKGPALRGRAAVRPNETLLFEYIGDTALTVFGGATRRRYRFSDPGARVQVDARDGSSLTSIPRLKLVTANAL